MIASKAFGGANLGFKVVKECYEFGHRIRDAKRIPDDVDCVLHYHDTLQRSIESCAQSLKEKGLQEASKSWLDTLANAKSILHKVRGRNPTGSTTSAARNIHVVRDTEHIEHAKDMISGVEALFTLTTTWNGIQPNHQSQSSKHVNRIYGNQLSTPMKSYRYCLQEGNDEGEMIRERRLQQLLLSDRNYRLVCAYGPGGMGKTAALKWLCQDESVQKQFIDGIHVFSFGEAVQEAGIISQMRTCAFDFGSPNIEKQQLSTESNLDIAIRQFGTMFREGRFLVVIDDVWNSWKHVVEMFRRRVLQEGSRCSMVISCRASEREVIGMCEEKVAFGFLSPMSELSQNIVLSRLEDDEKKQVEEWKEQHQDSLQWFEKGVQECGGWVLCQSIASAILKDELKTWGEAGELAMVLQEWAASVSNNTTLTDGRTPEYEGNLRTIVKSGLERAQANMEKLCFSEDLSNSVAEKFRALCVIPKQKAIPESMLSKLWKLRENDTRRTINALEEMSMVNIIRVKGKGRFVEVHDKIIDLCGEMVVERNGEGAVGAHHRELLESCASVSNNADEKCNGWYRAWWDSSVWRVDKEGVEYMYGNVFRHLVDANLLEEACALLLDPRWTVKQIRTGGIRQVLDDYTLVIEAVRMVEKMNTEVEKKRRRKLSSGKKALELVKEAVALSSAHISRNDKEAWYQLYGRLIGSKEVVDIGNYLEKITKHAEKPWVQCEGVSLLQAGGAVKQKWYLKGWILDSCFGQDGSVIVASATSTDRCTCEIRRLEQHEAGEGMKIWSVDCEGETLKGVLSENGEKLALFMKNGRIKVCDIESKRVLGCTDAAHNGRRRCMAFCEDGSRLTFVSGDNNVEVWKIGGTEMSKIESLKHEEEVVCVGLSGNGRTVAAGRRDGRVDVWDIDTGNVDGWFVDELIQSVAFSRYGRIATFSKEGMKGGSISVWNVEKGRRNEQMRLQLFKPLGFGLHELRWSPDDQMVGLLYNFEMQLWNVCDAPHKIKSAFSVRPFGIFHSMNWSADGTLIVAGSADEIRVVRVGAMNWAQLSDSLELELSSVGGDEKPEWLYARWSGDGSVVATCCENGEHVWLWDSHGKRLQPGEVLWDKGALGLVKHLAWANERPLLALACERGVQLWDTQRREFIELLPSPSEPRQGSWYDVWMETLMEPNLASMCALSGDGAWVVVAFDLRHDVHTLSFERPRVRKLLLWHISATPPQLCFEILLEKVGSFCKGLACSHNGVVASYHENEVRVFDSSGFLRGFLDVQRGIRALSFDARENVLIEWQMVMEEEGHAPQFSVWRWQHHNAPAPLPRTVPYLRGHQLHDAQHSHLATLENFAYFRLLPRDDYDYNANADAFAVVHRCELHLFKIHRSLSCDLFPCKIRSVLERNQTVGNAAHGDRRSSFGPS